MVCSMGLKPGAGRLIASLKFEATFSVSSFWLQFVQLLSCFMHIYLKVLIAGGVCVWICECLCDLGRNTHTFYLSAVCSVAFLLSCVLIPSILEMEQIKLCNSESSSKVVCICRQISSRVRRI